MSNIIEGKQYLHTVCLGTIRDSFSGPSNRILNWKEFRKVGTQANIARPRNWSGKDPSRHLSSWIVVNRKRNGKMGEKTVVVDN